MNKNNKILSLFLAGVLIILSLAVLGAAEVEMSTGLTDGKVTVDVSYKSLDDDDDNTKNLNSTRSLVFENKGNVSEEVSLSLSEVASGYQLRLSESSFTLNASGSTGSSKSVELTATVPIDADAGNHTIGKLHLGSLVYEVITIVDPMLEIRDIKAYVDNSKVDTIDNDRERIKDVRPGKEVELRFKIKNLFDNDYRYGDIDGAELKVEFADSDSEDDFGDDIYESEEFDLGAGEETGDDEVTIKFTVPVEAKEDTYELAVSIEGEDDNGAKHTVDWIVELEIDRVKDDVQIESASLTGNNLKCVRDTQLKVKLTNFGNNKQKEAALSIYNSPLGINYNFIDIYLDNDPSEDDNSYSKTVSVSIGDEVAAGEYDIEIRAYINNDEEVEHKFVRLVLENCETADIAEEENNSGSEEVEVVVQGPATESELPPAAAAGEEQIILETTETPFTQIRGVVILMSLVGLLLVVLIILVVFILIKKRD